MSGRGIAEVLERHGLQFDSRQRLLLTKGRKVVLDPRSALVVQALLDRFDEDVSKDSLLAAAWPGR